MLSQTVSTIDEPTVPQLTEEETRVSQRLNEARCEYRTAKQKLDRFADAMLAHPLDTTTAGILMLTQLAARERSALHKFAQALLALHGRAA
jgi:hypothetical protein